MMIKVAVVVTMMRKYGTHLVTHDVFSCTPECAHAANVELLSDTQVLTTSNSSCYYYKHFKPNTRLQEEIAS